MTDEQIIELYKNRDENAIKSTSDKYGAYCNTVAYNILYSVEDAKECINDTWLKAWNSIPPHIPQVLRQFLVKITRNIALDMYRAKNAKKRGNGEVAMIIDELAECVAGSGNVESDFIAKEMAEAINSFLAGLKKRESDIFLRRYFYADSVEDIADKYDVSKANVLMILSRVRKKLKVFLEKEGYLQ